MFFRRKKKRDFDILTEAEIRKKLYGYLEEDKPEDVKDFKKKAEIIEKEEVQKEARDRIKALEKELASTRKSLQTSHHKINQLENKILPKEEKPIFKKSSHFEGRKSLKVFLILIVIVAIGLILLISRKKTTISLNDTQTISLGQTEAGAPYKSFYAIQVCLYEKEKDARQLVGELKQKKFNAYVYPHKYRSQTKYRVYVGRFSSEKSALRTLKDLKNTFKDSFVRLVK